MASQKQIDWAAKIKAGFLAATPKNLELSHARFCQAVAPAVERWTPEQWIENRQFAELYTELFADTFGVLFVDPLGRPSGSRSAARSKFINAQIRAIENRINGTEPFPIDWARTFGSIEQANKIAAAFGVTIND